MRLQRQSDATQTLTLYGKSNDSTTVQLFQRKNLPSNFDPLPADDSARQQPGQPGDEDEDQGTFSYSTSAPSTDDRFLTFYTDTSSSEFDYVELRVPE